MPDALENLGQRVTEMIVHDGKKWIVEVGEEADRKLGLAGETFWEFVDQEKAQLKAKKEFDAATEELQRMEMKQKVVEQMRKVMDPAQGD